MRLQEHPCERRSGTFNGWDVDYKLSSVFVIVLIQCPPLSSLMLLKHAVTIIISYLTIGLLRDPVLVYFHYRLRMEHNAIKRNSVGLKMNNVLNKTKDVSVFYTVKSAYTSGVVIIGVAVKQLYACVKLVVCMHIVI